MNAAAPAYETTTRTWTKSVRQTARCGCCKKANSREQARTYTNSQTFGLTGFKSTTTFRDHGHAAPFACCGREWHHRDVKGTYRPEIRCNAKCTGSIGHVCECSCGGANHGKSHG